MTTNSDEEIIEKVIKRIDLKGYWNVATKKEALNRAFVMKDGNEEKNYLKIGKKITALSEGEK